MLNKVFNNFQKIIYKKSNFLSFNTKIQYKMGLDIKEFKGKDQVKGNTYVGNPDAIRESETKRFRDPKLVDIVIEQEQERVSSNVTASLKRKEINDINKAIGKKMKADKEADVAEELAKKAALEKEILELQEKEQQSLVQRDISLNKVGNFVHESVPVFKDEDDNVNEFQWGDDKINKDFKITEEPGFCHHQQILLQIDGYDPLRGQKVAGHRGYFLKGYGFLLNQALIQYGIKFLTERGYTPVQPPFFMKAETMAQTAQLSDFDEQLYKIVTKHGTNQNGEEEEQKKEEKLNKIHEEVKQEYYMIATSEQPISAMHSKEVMELKEGQSIKYAGYSTNFRKEAGKAGKETWGVFRVHQFEKIEQFVICRPEDSWAIHKDMVEVAQDFLKSLELPHRTMNIVSGALNDSAAKKYDVEAWFPGYGEYKELMSVSNCTDYQSRALDIKCGHKQKTDKITKYVHMLNGTLCATERTLTCILENYQEAEGLRVPTVLQPYVGTDFIKYVNPVTKLKDLQKAN